MAVRYCGPASTNWRLGVVGSTWCQYTSSSCLYETRDGSNKTCNPSGEAQGSAGGQAATAAGGRRPREPQSRARRVAVGGATCTDSACPVPPPETWRYVGLSTNPPVYLRGSVITASSEARLPKVACPGPSSLQWPRSHGSAGQASRRPAPAGGGNHTLHLVKRCLHAPAVYAAESAITIFVVMLSYAHTRNRTYIKIIIIYNNYNPEIIIIIQKWC